MRILLLAVCLSCALIVMQKCWGCNREFRNLGKHIDQCGQVLALLQGGLQDDIDREARLAEQER